MELCGEGGEKAAKCSDKTSHLRYFIHNILDFVIIIESRIIVFVKHSDKASEVFTYFGFFHCGKTSTSGIAKKASLPKTSVSVFALNILNIIVVFCLCTHHPGEPCRLPFAEGDGDWREKKGHREG